tara:strand:+ start:9560 stop:10168 length:609 start_codon:yes stop_codon:yes gene_type:complete
MNVVIIDYGLGNVASLSSAIKEVKNCNLIVSNSEQDIFQADKLILPGVGSFDQAMANLRSLDLVRIITSAAESIPILGICLGMQILCSSSTEGSLTKGLDLVAGEFNKFASTEYTIPHIGFNQVDVSNPSILFEDISDNPDFYFVHSYRLHSAENILSHRTQYIDSFISAFESKYIFGTQFHPELSQTNGSKLLQNFLDYDA